MLRALALVAAAREMLFCPNDGNLLLVESIGGTDGRGGGGGGGGAGGAGAGSSGRAAAASSSSSSSSSSSLAPAPASVRFYCQTCPYVQAIQSRREQRLPLARKKVDDVLGGEDAWKNVDVTEVRCPNCAHTRAFFMQIQIRSADEPMTVFYKCEKCSRAWSSN